MVQGIDGRELFCDIKQTRKRDARVRVRDNVSVCTAYEGYTLGTCTHNTSEPNSRYAFSGYLFSGQIPEP